MILEVYIILLIVTIALFFTAFFTKYVILWALTSIMSAVLILSSWDIEYYMYQYNATIYSYSPTIIHLSYGYMSGIGVALFGLSLVLLFFDIYNDNMKK